MTRLVAAAVLLCVAILAAPAAAIEGLREGASAVVADVVDGDTVVLDDGTEVRLVGIQAPKLPLGRADFETQPLAPEAKAAMRELALGQRVTLYYGGQPVDRWSRALAHLRDERGRWLQGEMLSRGLARVYSFADNRAMVAEMLTLERVARGAGRGIWAHPFYAVRSALETPRFIDSFQIIEGRVVSASIIKGRAYMNFGDDWREDFTVTVAPRDMSLFREAGLDIEALSGQRVRVRGWLKHFNGPQIEATHPEQIEVLGP